MTILPITPRQAGFLNNVADAAKYYKKACEDMKYFADRDIDLLNTNQRPHGPSHQVLFELTKYYGELNALLATVFLIFDPTIFEENMNAKEDREKFVKDVNNWVEIAVTGPTGDDYSVYFQAEGK